ncbi:MAG: hypothetical protein L0Z50_05520 [Verrucomicrobiales bacterium]|nr:hypothetical protein [Verrucomicrobiales bacterium]
MIALIIENLQQADYLHVLLNPVPIYGLAMGTLALVIGFVMKSRAAQILALWLVLVSALSAWPVYFYGQCAYHRVYIIADSDGQVWLDQHRRRAEQFIYAFYVLAAVALSALVVPRKKPKTAWPLAVVVFALSAATLAVAGSIAYPGGKIRHPEFRLEQDDANDLDSRRSGAATSTDFSK